MFRRLPRATRSPVESTASAPTPWSGRIRQAGGSLLRSQQIGLVVVLLLLGAALSAAAGSHPDRVTGEPVNNFLNAYTLIQMATDASAFAIMGVGMTIVIISGGIDLSVGAIYALSGVTMAMVLRALPALPPGLQVVVG